MSRCWQCGEGCRGGLYEERLGLPHAGHSWFLPAPVDPLQDTAEPLSHGWGTSGKVCVERSKRCQVVRSEGKSVRNSPVNTRKEWGGGAPGARTEISLQPLERPQWNRWFSAAGGEDHAERISTLQTMEYHVKTDIHTAAHGGPHAREGG